jgi:Rab proteins geranylgeranyltransferase component A
MMLDEPAQFDLVLLGTGPVTSLVAAAAAQVGKSVVHVDARQYYGAAWASLNAKQFIQWANQKDEEQQQSKWFDREQCVFVDPEIMEMNEEYLNLKNREFSIDRTEHLVFANGPLVNLLIRANCTEYFLFSLVEDQFYAPVGKDKDRLEFVKLPVSKSDIFQTKFLSLVEKRQLMKFVHQVIGVEERFAKLPSNASDSSSPLKDENNKPFLNLIQEQGLSPQVSEMLTYGVSHNLIPQENLDAMKEENILKASTALEFFSAYIQSFQRFGQGSFLYPIYGLGSIPEMMCRRASVFNGIYLLSTTPTDLCVNKETNQLEGIILPSGQRVEAKNLLFDSEYLSPSIHAFEFNTFSRCLLITKSPIKLDVESEAKNKCSTFVIPCNHRAINNKNPIRIVQLDYTTKTCPKDTYIIHIKTLMDQDPANDLNAVVAHLFPKTPQEKKDENEGHEEGQISSILLKCFYKERHPTQSSLKSLESRLPRGVYCTSEQYPGLSEIEMLKKAKELFSTLYPTESFFPEVDRSNSYEDEELAALSQLSIPQQ